MRGWGEVITITILKIFGVVKIFDEYHDEDSIVNSEMRAHLPYIWSSYSSIIAQKNTSAFASLSIPQLSMSIEVSKKGFTFCKTYQIEVDPSKKFFYPHKIISEKYCIICTEAIYGLS